jgi:hypothetical protein
VPGFQLAAASCQKHHGHKLAPTGKTSGAPFGMLLDGLLKLVAWE